MSFEQMKRMHQMNDLKAENRIIFLMKGEQMYLSNRYAQHAQQMSMFVTFNAWIESQSLQVIEN